MKPSRGWDTHRTPGETVQLESLSYLIHRRNMDRKAEQEKIDGETWTCTCGNLENPGGLDQCLECCGSREETELKSAHDRGLCGGAGHCKTCGEAGQ